MRKSIAAFIVPFVLLAVLIVGAARADAKPVGLADAKTPPTYLVYLWSGGSVTYASEDDGYNCVDSHGRGKSWFTDVSAYSWRGGPVGNQHWTEHHTLIVWKVKTGRVTFDGITFRNESRQRVLVAGWCD